MNVESIVAGASTGGVIGILYVVWKLFKHSRCHSHCCGKEASLSVDLEEGFQSKKVVELPKVLTKEEVNAP